MKYLWMGRAVCVVAEHPEHLRAMTSKYDMGTPPGGERKSRRAHSPLQEMDVSASFGCPFVKFRVVVEFQFLIIFSKEFAKLSLITARDNKSRI